MSVSPLERVMARVVETPGPLDTPCWIPTFKPRTRGYMGVKVGGHNGHEVRAHRVTYEGLVGPIPEGLILDHLCRVTGCVNPAHLEPVTNAENTSRGDSPSAIAVRTGLCWRGHSLDDAYVFDGKRHCRQCRVINKRAYRQRKRAA